MAMTGFPATRLRVIQVRPPAPLPTAAPAEPDGVLGRAAEEATAARWATVVVEEMEVPVAVPAETVEILAPVEDEAVTEAAASQGTLRAKRAETAEMEGEASMVADLEAMAAMGSLQAMEGMAEAGGMREMGQAVATVMAETAEVRGTRVRPEGVLVEKEEVVAMERGTAMAETAEAEGQVAMTTTLLAAAGTVEGGETGQGEDSEEMEAMEATAAWEGTVLGPAETVATEVTASTGPAKEGREEKEIQTGRTETTERGRLSRQRPSSTCMEPAAPCAQSEECVLNSPDGRVTCSSSPSSLPSTCEATLARAELNAHERKIHE